MSQEEGAFLLQKGLLQGKLPGQKDFTHLYLELTLTQLCIYEGHINPSLPRMHLRTLEIHGSDVVNEEKRKKKNLYRFSLSRADGKYLFQCPSETEQQGWMDHMRSVIQLKDEPRGAEKKSVKGQTLPPVPGHNIRASIASNDSGIGPSTDGEIRRLLVANVRTGSSSLPSSGDGTFCRSTATHGATSSSSDSKSFSDSGKFNIRKNDLDLDSEELCNYQWFWGPMGRADCENRLTQTGKCGNFVVRVNASGDFVMSFWRDDCIHHYRIVQRGKMWYFDRSALKAEGYSLVDLLDTYLKNCTDKKVAPFGGTLHIVYDEAWNPPPVDMEELGKRLKEAKVKGDEEKYPSKEYERQQQTHTAKPGGGGRKPKLVGTMAGHRTSDSSIALSAGHGWSTLPPQASKKVGPPPPPKKVPMAPSGTLRPSTSGSEEDVSDSKPTPASASGFLSELQRQTERKAVAMGTGQGPVPLPGLETGHGSNKKNAGPGPEASSDHTYQNQNGASANSRRDRYSPHQPRHAPQQPTHKKPVPPPTAKKPVSPSRVPSQHYVNVFNQAGVAGGGGGGCQEEGEEEDIGGEEIYLNMEPQEEDVGGQIYQNISPSREGEEEDVGGQEIYVDMSGQDREGESSPSPPPAPHFHSSSIPASSPNQYMNLSASVPKTRLPLRQPNPRLPQQRVYQNFESPDRVPVPPKRTTSTLRH